MSFNGAVVQLTPRCRRCNRPLKNQQSIALGIGSTCIRKAVGKRRKKRKRVAVDWSQMDLFRGPQQLDLFGEYHSGGEAL